MKLKYFKEYRLSQGNWLWFCIDDVSTLRAELARLGLDDLKEYKDDARGMCFNMTVNEDSTTKSVYVLWLEVFELTSLIHELTHLLFNYYIPIMHVKDQEKIARWMERQFKALVVDFVGGL